MSKNKKVFLGMIMFLITVLITSAGFSDTPVHAADSPDEQPESSALSPVAQTAVCTPDAAGMRAYWPFDDPISTTSFADVIDNPVFNDGACVGDTCPASTSDSKVGSAFVFDSNDEIHVVDTSGLDFTIAGDMAIETWVKTSQDCSSRVVFVGRYEGLDLAAWWLGCIENNKAAFHMRDSNGNKYMVTSTTTINDGQWHHIVGTRDGTANLNNIYVDGVLEDSLTPNFTGSLDFSAKDVTIAHYDSPAPFYWLNGVLDEMALYDQALPGSEVTRHYLNGQGQSYCNDDLPIPGGITFFTNVDGSLPFTENQLLTKDVAPDGGLHLISIAPTSLNGGTITGSGPFVYNPPPGFIGTDKFSYIIADVDNDQAAAEATVIVQDIVATIYLPILFKNH